MRLSRRTVLGGFTALVAQRAAAARSPGRQYELTNRELHVPGLDPAHDGLRVAQLSDLHVGFNTPDERIRTAIADVNAAAPDVVMLTGDFVTYCEGPVAHVPEVLVGISAPTFAVLGNHDHFVDAQGVRNVLERTGVTVLQNEWTSVRVRGAPLTMVGIDDGVTKHADAGKALNGAPSTGSRLVMAHTPTTARALPPGSNLVCFSGHTHGGQLVVPKLTDGLMRALGEPYIRGLYEVNGNALYVNRGLGWGRTHDALHHGAEPEVALFTLRCVA